MGGTFSRPLKTNGCVISFCSSWVLPTLVYRDALRPEKSPEFRNPRLHSGVLALASGIPGVRGSKSRMPPKKSGTNKNVWTLLEIPGFLENATFCQIRPRLRYFLLLHCAGGSYEGFTILNRMFIALESLKVSVHHLSKQTCYQKCKHLIFT